MNRNSELRQNPFSVKTPETLNAKELVSLFVPYPEYQNLQVSGHQFLHGHRGSGKSMMLRMMTPNPQCITHNCEKNDLPYYGAYLSIKATELNAVEYQRLEEEPSGFILSEHVLITKLLSSLFVSIQENFNLSDSNSSVFCSFLDTVIKPRLAYAGWDNSNNKYPIDFIGSSAPEILSCIIETFDKIQAEAAFYVRRRGFSKEFSPYNGALFSFQDTLIPIIKGLRKYSILPNCPVYFLLDDADNLTRQQTQILNTWVSYRSTDIISLKISTQMGYKTYRTSSGINIESPHDFSEINFTSVYTGSIKENYPNLVRDIVKKRLTRIGLDNISPDDFFPEDKNQVEKIKQISEEIKTKWFESSTGGYRPGDDAYRSARPEFIRRLSGISKQGARYKYAGFEQLVHISSGIIRYFLEPAARMYADQQKANHSDIVTFISPEIQDDEIRKQSNELIITQFENLKDDELSGVISSGQLSDIDRLRNLITAIGSVFQAHIMDENASQRRIFSFALSDTPPDELRKILQIGVQYGYLYEDSIGRKDGMGRQKLYVLTRRLAPAFKLDPMGFSGYLTFKSDFLLDVSEKPSRFVSRLRKRGLDVLEPDPQLSLLSEPTDE